MTSEAVRKDDVASALLTGTFRLGLKLPAQAMCRHPVSSPGFQCPGVGSRHGSGKPPGDSSAQLTNQLLPLVFPAEASDIMEQKQVSPLLPVQIAGLLNQ